LKPSDYVQREPTVNNTSPSPHQTTELKAALILGCFSHAPQLFIRLLSDKAFPEYRKSLMVRLKYGEDLPPIKATWNDSDVSRLVQELRTAHDSTSILAESVFLRKFKTSGINVDAHIHRFVAYALAANRLEGKLWAADFLYEYDPKAGIVLYDEVLKECVADGWPQGSSQVLKRKLPLDPALIKAAMNAVIETAATDKDELASVMQLGLDNRLSFSECISILLAGDREDTSLEKAIGILVERIDPEQVLKDARCLETLNRLEETNVPVADALRCQILERFLKKSNTPELPLLKVIRSPSRQISLLMKVALTFAETKSRSFYLAEAKKLIPKVDSAIDLAWAHLEIWAVTGDITEVNAALNSLALVRSKVQLRYTIPHMVTWLIKHKALLKAPIFMAFLKCLKEFDADDLDEVAFDVSKDFNLVSLLLIPLACHEDAALAKKNITEIAQNCGNCLIDGAGTIVYGMYKNLRELGAMHNPDQFVSLLLEKLPVPKRRDLANEIADALCDDIPENNSCPLEAFGIEQKTLQPDVATLAKAIMPECDSEHSTKVRLALAVTAWNINRTEAREHVSAAIQIDRFEIQVSGKLKRMIWSVYALAFGIDSFGKAIESILAGSALGNRPIEKLSEMDIEPGYFVPIALELLPDAPRFLTELADSMTQMKQLVL
jgi:hypothetical protein